MEIFDITLSIQEGMAVWPGQSSVELAYLSHTEQGDSATVTRLRMSVHTGTHLDAPMHFIQGGAGVETLDLNVLIGPAWMIDLSDAAHITAEALAAADIPAGTERLLIRTRNSQHWAAGQYFEFDRDYVAIEDDGAAWLVERGVRLVGVDYYSVAPFGNTKPTHITLLSAGVIPVEGLDLIRIEPGVYELICLPLKIAGRAGAPCRAVLRR